MHAKRSDETGVHRDRHPAELVQLGATTCAPQDVLCDTAMRAMEVLNDHSTAAGIARGVGRTVGAVLSVTSSRPSVASPERSAVAQAGSSLLLGGCWVHRSPWARTHDDPLSAYRDCGVAVLRETGQSLRKGPRLTFGRSRAAEEQAAGHGSPSSDPPHRARPVHCAWPRWFSERSKPRSPSFPASALSESGLGMPLAEHHAR